MIQDHIVSLHACGGQHTKIRASLLFFLKVVEGPVPHTDLIGSTQEVAMTFINLFNFHIASKANAILLLLARQIKQTVNPPTPPSSRHPLQVPVHLRPLAPKDLNTSSTLLVPRRAIAVSSTCYCGSTGQLDGDSVGKARVIENQ